MRWIATAMLASGMLACPPPSDATTWHVPTDVPTIQAGVNSAADGDTVLVAPGTYTGQGNYDINFGGKAITLLSEGGPDVTIIDVEGDPSHVRRAFRFDHGETSTSIVDGFRIRNGYARWGGAIYCGASSPAVANCVFFENAAWDDGGAISCKYNSSPSLSSCTFCNNSTASFAGGLFCDEASSPTLANCIIAFSLQGAAVHCSGGSGPTLTCCDVFGNADGDWVGCIASQEGINGNFSGDPLFCHRSGEDFAIAENSPCAPDSSPAGCDLVGALGIGCAAPQQEVRVVSPNGGEI